MTTQKDFKRVVRARMQKTGESYTAARANLLTKPVSPTPDDYPRLAGMSDAAVKKATGCTWASWVRSLDYHKAHTWEHRQIAEYVHQKYKVPAWWTQTVTVGYERIKGLRAIGQRRDGGYEANRSKTFTVPTARLFRAFNDKRGRAKWLAVPELVVRTATRDRSMRITWPDATSVSLWFVTKGDAKAAVQVQHTGLPDKAAADRMKAFWGEKLTALGRALNP